MRILCHYAFFEFSRSLLILILFNFLFLIFQIIIKITHYKSLRRHCGEFDVFLAGIKEKLAGINNVYAL